MNPTPAVFDGFGHSISAVGTNIIVGAFFDDEGASDAGAAHLFKQIPNQPPIPPCQSGQAGGDLVSYWRAENNACDAADGNHGTPVGGTTFAAGKVGQAFSLDGANDYVSVPSTGVPVGGSPRTVKLWIKPDASSLAADLNNAFFYGITGVTHKAFGVDMDGISPTGTVKIQVWTWADDINGLDTGVLQGNFDSLVTRPV